MQYTQRDLAIAERSVTALEKFIKDQQLRFAAVEWEAAQREELDRLLTQFEETLRAQRALYHEIWVALHPASDAGDGAGLGADRRNNGTPPD
jgi:saccharopine dehydrogenase-like NADP-dependent oxidoreductase